MNSKGRGVLENPGWTPTAASERALETTLSDEPASTFDGSLAFSFPVERLMPRHADIGTVAYPGLTDLIEQVEPQPERTLRICIATPDISGPIAGGGIGTAYWHAARFLAEAGHEVTVLYTLGRQSQTEPVDHWIAHYASLGITFVPLPDTEVKPAEGVLSMSLYRARATYEWLRDQSFDIVHGTEWMGHLYYALAAKRLGLAFAETVFLIKASSPLLWNMAGNGELLTRTDMMIRTYAERKSIEYADYVVSPGRHMLKWMMRRGYDLPKERCFVQPNVYLPEGGATRRTEEERAPVQEFVFFGRLDNRKGLPQFLRALEIASEGLRDRGISVTFLGKWGAPEEAYKKRFEASAASWAFEWRRISDLPAPEAIDYLRGEGRVAVIPSLLDNAPFTVLECLMDGIPFLTTDRGGTPELIREEDRGDVCVKPLPSMLADALLSTADKGARVAQAAFNIDANLDLWRKAHLAFASPAIKGTAASLEINSNWNGVEPKSRGREAPLVSVCIAHFERPELLKHALWSLTRQSYKTIEVIVVDDGSAKNRQAEIDAAISAYATELDIRLVRQANRYLGATRNAGWREARGDFILFMDDDNLAAPHEIETFLNAAHAAGADILTAFYDRFTDEPSPGEFPDVTERVSPLGDNVSLGIFLNCYGDSNCFVRRSVLESLGGFTEDYGVGLDDQEFFSRAVLNGFKLRVVPEPLYFYRHGGSKLRDSHFSAGAGRQRVLHAYLDRVPPALHDALNFAAGQMTANAALTGEISRKELEISRLTEELRRARSFKASLVRIGSSVVKPLSRILAKGRAMLGLRRP